MKTLRILQVGSSMPKDWGGIERYVCNLSAALTERGHDVTIVAPQGSPLAAHSPVPCYHLRMRSKYDILAKAGFQSLFQSGKFDVVNVHFSPDYLVPAWAAKAVGQRGLVLTRHVALPFSFARAKQYDHLYNRFIGVSGAVVEALRASKLPEAKLSQVNTGIPPARLAVDRQTARGRMRIAEGALAVGVFGRLVKEKGQDVLFRAARDSGEFEVHCFGSGPMQKVWEKEFSGPAVRFHGHVERVVDAMVGMDVVCVPSVWPEALGLVVLEAMSLGLPIVASKVGGIPEAVENGVNGILVQAGDPDELVHAIARFKTDHELRARFGTAAKAYFDRERTPATMAEQTESAYLEMLGSV